MLEGLQDRLRLALVQVKIDDGMPYWKYVDIVLDGAARVEGHYFVA